METQLTTTEINAKQQQLQDYQPAQPALALLAQNQGRLDTTFDQLWAEKTGQMYDPSQPKSVWQITLNVLRQELCGDESFRTKVKEYTKNPGSTPLLTGLIVSLVGLAGLPIDPAIATVIVLYIIKVGLNVFCEYTQPVDEAK
ncbi:MAG: hypothetical protein F6K14_18500 [Symploca sp. SIO2C1]|nr:hypothetical protein [Symploca sp. SIO2C1]